MPSACHQDRSTPSFLGRDDVHLPTGVVAHRHDGVRQAIHAGRKRLLAHEPSGLDPERAPRGVRVPDTENASSGGGVREALGLVARAVFPNEIDCVDVPLEYPAYAEITMAYCR